MVSDPKNGDDDDLVDQVVDPETRFADLESPFGDPEQSGLIPEVSSSFEPTDTETETATPESADFSEVDPELLNRFVLSAVLIKAGIILFSAGVLVIGFRGQTGLGSAIILAGVLAIVRAAQHSRARNRTGSTHTETHPSPGTTDQTSTDTADNSNTDTNSVSTDTADNSATEPDVETNATPTQIPNDSDERNR